MDKKTTVGDFLQGVNDELKKFVGDKLTGELKRNQVYNKYEQIVNNILEANGLNNVFFFHTDLEKSRLCLRLQQVVMM